MENTDISSVNLTEEADVKAEVEVPITSASRALEGVFMNTGLNSQQGDQDVPNINPTLADLIAASTFGNINGIRRAINGGVDVNGAVEFGTTALIEAANSGQVDCIKELLLQGANINAKNAAGDTALITATIRRHVRCMEYLIANGSNIDAKNNIGWTALMYSTCVHGPDCFKLLLENKASIQVQSNDGLTIEDLVKYVPSLAKCLSRFLEESNQPSTSTDTRMPIETQGQMDHHHEGEEEEAEDEGEGTGEEEVIVERVAVAARADLDEPGPLNAPDSPTLAAGIPAEESNWVDPAVNNSKKQETSSSPTRELFDAHEAFFTFVNSGNVEAVRYLLEHGFSVEQRCRKFGDTPLIVAASRGRLGLICELVACGANIEAENDNGVTAVGRAALYGHYACMEYLIIKRCNIDAVDKKKWTPLMYAAACQNFDCFELLMKRGAKINLRNSGGDTVKDIAEAQVNKAFVDYLETYEPPEGSRGNESGGIPSVSKSVEWVRTDLLSFSAETAAAAPVASTSSVPAATETEKLPTAEEHESQGAENSMNGVSTQGAPRGMMSAVWNSLPSWRSGHSQSS